MKQSKFLADFKAFAMRGNVVDMAVGIIIGAAFGKIVSSLVADLIMPLVGLLIGGIDFTSLHIVLKHAVTNTAGEVMKPAVLLNYGNLIQTTVDFLIIALAVFCMIKGIARLSQKKEETPAPPAPPAPSEEAQLLTQIRDLLQKKQ